MENKDKKIKKIDSKELNKIYFKWILLAEVSNSFERMQALAVTASFASTLRKLYPEKEKFVNALKRHLIFFNTEAIWGSLIHGAVIAMEEEKAEKDNIPEEAIVGIKTGLMGPLAGIGDTLDFATIQTIFSAIAVTFATTGSAFAAVFPTLFAIIVLVEGYLLFRFGYKLGRNSIKEILSGGLVNKLIDGAGILGIFMMGTLSGSLVKLNTSLKINVGTGFGVQEILDKIAPGLLPLGVIALVYYLMKYKKVKMNNILWLLILFSILGSLIGVF